jgi:hypothetical protein
MPVNADPFTGGGSYTPSAAPPPSFSAPAAPPAQRALAYCPCRAAVLFESTPAGLEGCGRKLREFSAAAAADAPGAALTAEEDATLSALLAALAPGGGGGVPDGAAALFSKLLSWREGHLFAVLDLCRGAMLLEGAASALLRADGGDALLGALLRAAAGASVGAAAVVTALRCVANAAGAPPGAPQRAWALNARDTLLEAFAAAPGCPSKPARAAFTTALLNFGVAATSASDGAPDARASLLPAAVAAAAAVPPEDDDAAFRALVTVGTLAAADVGTAAAAAQLGAGDVAAAAAGRTGAGTKAPAAAADVTDILRRSGAMA